MEIKELERITNVLGRGGVVVFPTETVYGLGVDPFIKIGIKRLYDIKKRDRRKPLTLHLADPLDIYKFAYVDHRAQVLIQKFLPGPLTIILPKKRAVPRRVVAGKNKVGFRIPSCKIARDIIKFYGRPIAATSVNISGSLPLNNIKDIEKKFGELVDYIVLEPCELSKKASTVLDLTVKPFKILRYGEISKEDIEKIIGKGG